MLWIFVGTDNVKNLSSHPLQHGLGRVYWFGRASITKCHRLGGLNQRNLFSQISGGQSPRSSPARLVSGETPLLASQRATFPLCSLKAFPLCQSRESSLVSRPLLIRAQLLFDQGLPMMSLNLHTSSEALSPNTVALVG